MGLDVPVKSIFGSENSEPVDSQTETSGLFGSFKNPKSLFERANSEATQNQTQMTETSFFGGQDQQSLFADRSDQKEKKPDNSKQDESPAPTPVPIGKAEPQSSLFTKKPAKPSGLFDEAQKTSTLFDKPSPATGLFGFSGSSLFSNTTPKASLFGKEKPESSPVRSPNKNQSISSNTPSLHTNLFQNQVGIYLYTTSCMHAMDIHFIQSK